MILTSSINTAPLIFIHTQWILENSAFMPSFAIYHDKIDMRDLEGPHSSLP
jgi:hypothetical protein